MTDGSVGTCKENYCSIFLEGLWNDMNNWSQRRDSKPGRSEYERGE